MQYVKIYGTENKRHTDETEDFVLEWKFIWEIIESSFHKMLKDKNWIILI